MAQSSTWHCNIHHFETLVMLKNRDRHTAAYLGQIFYTSSHAEYFAAMLADEDSRLRGVCMMLFKSDVCSLDLGCTVSNSAQQVKSRPSMQIVSE